MLIEFRSGHHEKSYEGKGEARNDADDHVDERGSICIVVNKSVRLIVTRCLKLTIAAHVHKRLTLILKIVRAAFLKIILIFWIESESNAIGFYP